jgi:uncharacterized protein (DUF2132 family)
MNTRNRKDPLEGMTLEAILKILVAHYGWKTMGEAVTINCFNKDPSISSSLKFLRRTPWARKKVEELYLTYLWEQEKK